MGDNMSSPSANNVTHTQRKTSKTPSPPPPDSSSTEKPVNPPSSKLRTFTIRFITGIIMIVGFLFLMSTGHAVISCFVVLLQIVVFKEMIALRFKEAKERNLMAFRTLNWYFMFVTMFYIYGPTVLNFLTRYVHVPNSLFIRHFWHSFVLYVIGFCGFVFTLRRQTLKYQFGLITWTIMIILIVVVQSHFILKNIHEGLIWFLLPHSLIICNDIMAYFVGISFGRKFVNRPLTPLSPNKTWEGFIGAILITILYALLASRILGNIEWYRCSAVQLELEGGCSEGFLFTPLPITTLFGDYLPQALHGTLSHISLTRMQLHSVVFAIFASTVAPFGGFLASAMKRAYQKKDFDDIIPGHGGATDRFDCQFIIGLFIFVYYTTWIKPSFMDVDTIITSIMTLPVMDQQYVLKTLQTALEGAM